MSSKSPRGPLPRFGGPQSKTFFKCKICDKKIRRDKLKEHFNSYVDMNTLKSFGQARDFSMSRLAFEKRRQTEQVKEYFDRNEKLPLDYNNSEFWLKAGAGDQGDSSSHDVFSLKRKTQDSGEVSTTEKTA